MPPHPQVQVGAVAVSNVLLHCAMLPQMQAVQTAATQPMPAMQAVQLKPDPQVSVQSQVNVHLPQSS